jgi:hypothetical protein
MLYFLVYNDNTQAQYIIKLLNSVKMYGKDFNIIIFNKSDIDTEFINNNKKILDLKKGGIWKPYFIKNILNKINNDDILFYIDNQYHFIEDFTNLFFDYMKSNDCLIFKYKPNGTVQYMKNYCKMDVIRKYKISDDVFNRNMELCWSGCIILKKNDNTIKYVTEWLNMCNYEDISDFPSKSKNESQFIEHSNEQSLLSIIVHKYDIPLQIIENKYLQNI